MSIRSNGRIIDCKGNFVFILPIVFRYSTITNLLQDPLKIKMLIPERGCESHPLFHTFHQGRFSDCFFCLDKILHYL